MAKYLIVYGTKEGQTAKIAQRIADTITKGGNNADIYDAKKAPATLSVDGYTGVLVGSSIHAGQWSTAVRNFVRKNQSGMDGIPSAFFSVSLAATGKDTTRLNSQVESFFKATGWHPKTVENFAGCLAYTKYGFIMRFLMAQGARFQSQPTDTSKDHEFTNWDEVTQFATRFVEQSQRGPPPETATSGD